MNGRTNAPARDPKDPAIRRGPHPSRESSVTSKSSRRIGRPRAAPPALRDAIDQLVRLLLACGIDKRVIRQSLAASLARRPAAKGNHAAADPAILIAASQVLTLWYQSPHTLAPSGLPKALPLSGREESLTALAGQTIDATHAKAVTQYLRRVRAIRRSGHRWKPTGRTLLVDRDIAGAAWHGLHSVAGLLSTINQNVQSPKQDRRFEARVHSGPLTARAARQIRRRARTQGDAFLARLDRDMQSAKTRTMPSTSKLRIGVGAYYYEMPE